MTLIRVEYLRPWGRVVVETPWGALSVVLRKTQWTFGRRVVWQRFA